MTPKKKDEEVYVVTLASTAEGQTLEMHVRAADPKEAKAKVLAAQGKDADILSVAVWTPPVDEEDAP